MDKKDTGERRGRQTGVRRFTAAFRIALQNRRAIFFPRENPPARGGDAYRGIYATRMSVRDHVIGRKRQKYAPIGRPSG